MWGNLLCLFAGSCSIKTINLNTSVLVQLSGWVCCRFVIYSYSHEEFNRYLIKSWCTYFIDTMKLGASQHFYFLI